MKIKLFLLSICLFFCIQQTSLAIVTEKTNQIKLNVADVIVISDKNKFGLKDKKGQIIVEPNYKKLIRVGKSSWIAQKGNHYGLIDSNGNVLVKIKYRQAERIFGQFAKLGNNHDYGLYSETGETIIPPEYTSIQPLYGGIFLTYKNYKYGIINTDGKVLLQNKYDDIYMPTRKTLRIKYKGEWFEIVKVENKQIELTANSEIINIDDTEFKITHLAINTAVISGYSMVTVVDYTLKLFSSISPAYEQTIDELLLSQGADTFSIFLKLNWIPKFPVTYLQKYIYNLKTPDAGPLADIREELKKEMKF